MRRWGIGFVASAVAILSGTPGCGPTVRRAATAPASPAPIEELWQSPTDLPQRDLFHGAGGASLLPRAESFTFVAKDKGGYSPGFDVRDAEGIEWSVKLGPEAQAEVTTSRILWSVGFHQPPTYYVSEWRMSGEQAGVQPGGRFRPTLPGQTVVGDWSWYDNQFMSSQEFRGLVVANLILNNWDWKTSNNKIYVIAEPGRAPRRQFVVRDLGASLGKTSYPSWLKWLGLRGFGQGSRNDVDGFEQQDFILGLYENSTVAFDYHGIHNDLVDSLSPADVRWTCELLSRLSDQQWSDAFRAGGFSPDHGDRYVRKIKAKLAQGLALPAASS
jgi:hypothetical protein